MSLDEYQIRIIFVFQPSVSNSLDNFLLVPGIGCVI